jgi:hypothetical protein
MRSAEGCAEIMRDPKRTGNWTGAERTARAFDRIAADLRTMLDLYSPDTAPLHFSPRTVTPRQEPRP